jgi:hypothetical protein
MTAIVLEHNPWIVVVQPYEDYGLRRYVEFHAEPGPADRAPALRLPAAPRLRQDGESGQFDTRRVGTP